MAGELTIAGHGARLVLHVERYEHADLDSGSDANWLAGAVELEVGTTGTFRAKRSVALRTEELAAFRDEVHALERKLTGEATLAHMESQLGVTIRLNRGNGTLAGFVREDVGAELRFDDIETDQTFLRQALRELDVLVDAFPLRGDPLD